MKYLWKYPWKQSIFFVLILYKTTNCYRVDFFPLECFPSNYHVLTVNMTNVKSSLCTTETYSFNTLHLNAPSSKNQFEEFELLSNSLKIFFLCIVVTVWFNDETYLNNFKLNGYDLFCSSHSTRQLWQHLHLYNRSVGD